MDQDQFVPFLIRAKQNTYASGKPAESSSRPHSHDLFYNEGEFQYIDTYLGGFHFIGEEAVWIKGTPIWGMNYYGKMLVEQVPDGFGEFLKSALMRVTAAAPFRGPERFVEESFVFQCHWEGTLEQFEGTEEISFHDVLIYRLVFHGGEVLA